MLVYLVTGENYNALDISRQSMLDDCVRLVPGARLRCVDSLDDWMSAPQSGVLLCPVLLPQKQITVARTLKWLESHRPFPVLFAMHFALIADSKTFQPDTLQDSFWIEQIDAFYDQAVPTSFSVCHGDLISVQQFHISTALSCAFRHLDNLQELSRISGVLKEFEIKISDLDLKIARKSGNGA